MLKKAVYKIPTVSASAETISSAANMDSAKNETYSSASGECDKDFYVQEWLKKQEEVYVQEEEKCRTKRKRAMNEHENAMKEVNNALRWFSKTVHCRDAQYTRCQHCNEFKSMQNLCYEKLHFKICFKFE